MEYWSLGQCEKVGRFGLQEERRHSPTDSVPEGEMILGEAVSESEE